MLFCYILSLIHNEKNSAYNDVVFIPTIKSYMKGFWSHASFSICHSSSMTVMFNTGVPDPPSNISLSLKGNFLRSSWDYVRIPTVDVTLYWSLLLFRPSQLSNMTTTLLNSNTYNYTLQGVRSCDPFRLCIRAENDVGNSSWSCNKSALPFLPLSKDIDYFLVQVNETFSLNVTVMVRYVIALLSHQE